jgi:hypothetical protein
MNFSGDQIKLGIHGYTNGLFLTCVREDGALASKSYYDIGEDGAPVSNSSYYGERGEDGALTSNSSYYGERLGRRTKI